jgi:signal recognition particle receptor subunit beta
MVFFNASTRELTAKIVYYGPGLGGKTTNLKVLHQRLEPRTAGELVQLSTESDRTIYFDLLPVELGDIRGYRIRFQLTTVPGQTAFNETRRVVLKGADGIVFVADSQWTLLPKNLESWQSLRENLAANALALDTMPVVVQYNKRDLPDILSVEAMQEALGFAAYPYVEAVASEGRGVTETFKLISKLTFLDLLRRLQGRPTPEEVASIGEPAGDLPTEEDLRPSLTLVRTPPEEVGADEGPSPGPAEDAPFPEAAAPFDAVPPSVPSEIAERLESLEARLRASETRAETVERLRARLEETDRNLEEVRDRLASEITSLDRRSEEKIRALEERIESEASSGRGAQERLFEEFGRLRERAEKLDEQTSAFARDLEEMQRVLSERPGEPSRAPEDLKLQLAPLLEEQVRRGTDENWTVEIERLRQALAESLEDLSERVRKAVRS